MLYNIKQLSSWLLRGEHYKQNRLNENFTKKEFQELWNRINHKYAYTVNFESKELIEKAIAAINKELVVSNWATW